MGFAVQRMCNKMPSILFVCLGNICRSPCAEGVLKHYSKDADLDLHVESCGLGDWHQGQLPDERMRRTANNRGIVLSSRAQALQHDYFDKFDIILAADNSVMYELHKWATTPEHKAKIHLITKYSKLYHEQEIPDPFYEDQAQFELVMDMIEDSCHGLITALENGPTTMPDH
jgi:protein-tyrosine phosphatase